MATIPRTPAYLQPQTSSLNPTFMETPTRLLCLSFKLKHIKHSQLNLSHLFKDKSILLPNFTTFSASGEATETTEVEETPTQEISDDVLVEDSSDGHIVNADEKPVSAIMGSVQSYKEALTSNDESKVAEVEAFLQSIEEEKNSLAKKVATLSEELSTERHRVIGITAYFENFRRTTDRERLSLVTNVQGELIESLLLVLDNFERTKDQNKVETGGEEKINNSYQSIYKQFVEVLGSLRIVPLETVENPFKPMEQQHRVDLKLRQILDEFFRVLNRVYSGLMKS